MCCVAGVETSAVTLSFVLLFPGQVLTDCRLRFATSMQALRALYRSIPLNELIPTLPFPSLVDAWLLKIGRASCREREYLCDLFVSFTIRFHSMRGFQR